LANGVGLCDHFLTENKPYHRLRLAVAWTMARTAVYGLHTAGAMELT